MQFVVRVHTRRRSVHKLHVCCGRLHGSRLYDQFQYVHHNATAQTVRSDLLYSSTTYVECHDILSLVLSFSHDVFIL